KGFGPRVTANVEPRIRELSRQLLDQAIGRGEMDLAGEISVPLPMMVIAQLIGIPLSDWARFRRWSDSILKLSYTMRGLDGEQAARSLDEFKAVTAEMDPYVAEMVAQRRAEPTDDLLTRLGAAEVDGEPLSHA